MQTSQCENFCSTQRDKCLVKKNEQSENVNYPSQGKAALGSFDEPITQTMTFCGVVQFHVYPFWHLQSTL